MRIGIVEAIEAEPLSVPLREPFVIATGRVDATHSVLVRARVDGVTGLGEASCLPGVTAETPASVLARIGAAKEGLLGRHGDLGDLLDSSFGDAPVARAGLECALLDATARARGTSVRAMLAVPGVTCEGELETDITIPILDRRTMVDLAIGWERRGFSVFKVKVGLDVAHDAGALAAIHQAIPAARFRLDANGGYTAEQALGLLGDVERRGLEIECFEQPCARGDVDGMAKVTHDAAIRIVADESVHTLEDLDAILRRRAATGVNLKIAKMGGILACLAIGRRARASGLHIMVGGMVETRLGMTSAMHVASAMGRVEYCDLDTAFLLADDPFAGGYVADGPGLRLSGVGFGVATR